MIQHDQTHSSHSSHSSHSEKHASNRDRLLQDLRESKKYRDACPDTLEHVTDWAAERYKTPKEALKAAKRKMHQIYGAYFDGAGLKQVQKSIDQIPAGASNDDLLEICAAILNRHASTRERLPILDGLYPSLIDKIGPVKTILDLGCGLNPFSWPWLASCAGIGEGVQYYACDIDGGLIEAINAFFCRIGRPETAYLHDILTQPFAPLTIETPDIVLLFKLLPCLEQRQKGASAAVLERIPGRHLIVSFPARSLGGRAKGMAGHYGAFIGQIICALNVTAQRIEFEQEIFYILTRK